MNYCVFNNDAEVGIEIPVDIKEPSYKVEDFIAKNLYFFGHMTDRDRFELNRNIDYDSVDVVAKWGYSVMRLS